MFEKNIDQITPLPPLDHVASQTTLFNGTFRIIIYREHNLLSFDTERNSTDIAFDLWHDEKKKKFAPCVR